MTPGMTPSPSASGSGSDTDASVDAVAPGDSYPTTESGAPDHAAAWTHLFPDGATRRSPTYITDGTETVAVIGRDGSEAVIQSPNTGHDVSWRADLRDLWNDYHHDALNYRRQTFLAPAGATYDSELEAAVDRETLQNVLAEAAGELPVETVAELEGALEAADADPPEGQDE